MNRRQVLKGLVSAVVWLPLLSIKPVQSKTATIYNPLSSEELPRKRVNFTSLVRQGGEVGHESFITEWHIYGPHSHLDGINFTNTEIHIHGTNSALINCNIRNTHRTYNPSLRGYNVT